MDGTQDEVIQNPATGRFELAEAPDRAYLDYRQADGKLTLVHTQVDDAFEGRGVGSTLVTSALDRAEHEGLTVVPECGFVAGWLERHPDRAAELDLEWPAR